MKQIFSKVKPEVNRPLMLDEAQAHHIFDVLRSTSREVVRVVCDEQVYLAHPDKKPYLYVFGKEEVSTRLVNVTLCPALIKADKFEWMLQKATELGVSRIVPFTSMNTIIHLDEKKLDKKYARWNAILEAAAKQCNRTDQVLLESVQTIQSLPEFKSKCNLIAYEKEDSTHHLASFLANTPDSVTIVIGPEGGFTVDEVEYLENNGFFVCSLGNSILRAETAACYVLSAIEYQTHLETRKEQA